VRGPLAVLVKQLLKDAKGDAKGDAGRAGGAGGGPNPHSASVSASASAPAEWSVAQAAPWLNPLVLSHGRPSLAVSDHSRAFQTCPALPAWVHLGEPSGQGPTARRGGGAGQGDGTNGDLLFRVELVALPRASHPSHGLAADLPAAPARLPRVLDGAARLVRRFSLPAAFDEPFLAAPAAAPAAAHAAAHAAVPSAPKNSAPLALAHPLAPPLAPPDLGARVKRAKRWVDVMVLGCRDLVSADLLPVQKPFLRLTVGGSPLRDVFAPPGSRGFKEGSRGVGGFGFGARGKRLSAIDTKAHAKPTGANANFVERLILEVGDDDE
jgi:hypothetical protein